MPQHINSASRLKAILLEAKHSNAPHCFQAWAHALGVPTEQNYLTAIAVMQRLIWLDGEVTAVREGMQRAAFSEQLYEPALAQVQNAIQPLGLGSAWPPLAKAHLTSEVLTSLGFCAEILPDEEAAISEDDLVAIRTTMAELEVLVQTTAISPRLRAIIQHHVDLIHEALDKYPVMGVIALRDAAWTAAGELLHAKNDPDVGGDDFSDRPEVAKLDSLWSKVNTVVDGASKVQSLFELGKTVVELIGK